MEAHKRSAAEWLLSHPMFCVNLTCASTPTPAARLFTDVPVPFGDCESLVRDGLLGLAEFGALRPTRHVPWVPTPPFLGHTHSWGDRRGARVYDNWVMGSHRALEWEYVVLVDTPRGEPTEGQRAAVARYGGQALTKPRGCSLSELIWRHPYGCDPIW